MTELVPSTTMLASSLLHVMPSTRRWSSVVAALRREPEPDDVSLSHLPVDATGGGCSRRPYSPTSLFSSGGRTGCNNDDGELPVSSPTGVPRQTGNHGKHRLRSGGSVVVARLPADDRRQQTGDFQPESSPPE
nr:hypothetical protein Iba_scaffold137CG0640 [Ipomoea batatas]GME19838.1 hypothetical protein Iba_scaffold23918CG0030 [Ipomoea batatas]